MDSTLLSAPPPVSDWRRRWLGNRAYWLVQLIGWSGVTLVQMAWILTLPSEHQAVEFAHALMFAFHGLLVSHLLRVVIHVLGLLDKPWLHIVTRLVPWVLIFSMVQALHVMGGIILQCPHEASAVSMIKGNGNLELLVDIWIGSLGALSSWTLAYYAIHYYRKYQKGRLDCLGLEAARKDAELRALKSQLNPHFLFNCLNSLRSMIPMEQQRPREAVSLLAELLRSSLNPEHKEVAPLSEELKITDIYLTLEQLRFENRLTVRKSIDPQTLNMLVPSFLLQTLVENAVKHGIAKLEQGGVVSIETRADEGGCVLVVQSPGCLMPGADHGGLGLANARARLNLLFGDEARLDLEQRDGSTVSARIWIPGQPVMRSQPRSPSP